jgi:hypothetical protein
MRKIIGQPSSEACVVYDQIRSRKFKIGRPVTNHVNTVPITRERIAEIEMTYVVPYILFLQKLDKSETRPNFPCFLKTTFNICRQISPPLFTEITKVFRRVQVRQAQATNRQKEKKIKNGEISLQKLYQNREEFKIVEPEKALTQNDFV